MKRGSIGSHVSFSGSVWSRVCSMIIVTVLSTPSLNEKKYLIPNRNYKSLEYNIVGRFDRWIDVEDLSAWSTRLSVTSNHHATISKRRVRRRAAKWKTIMDDRESPFVRAQASRSLIRPQPRKFTCLPPSPAMRQMTNRSPIANREPSSPGGGTPPKRLSASHTPLESLKQWELVEDDRGLQVVEKRAGALNPIRPKEAAVSGVASPFYDHSIPVSGRRFGGSNVDANLEEKLRVFNQSKIIQPIGLPLAKQQELAPLAPSLAESKAQPLSLDLILKQQQQQRTLSTTAESTDMLQRLEQQVKAIEMGTIAARTRQLENSSDFGPEVQLRYREHEDLLRNVTDDEAEG